MKLQHLMIVVIILSKRSNSTGNPADNSPQNDYSKQIAALILLHQEQNENLENFQTDCIRQLADKYK